MSELNDRIKPHNLEAEMAVLGSMILDEAALDEALSGRLKPEYFYNLSHRYIYSAIQSLRNDEATHVDLVTLTDYLGRHGLLEKVGGASALSRLADAVVSTANVSHYIEIVRGNALRRNLIDAANDIVKIGYDSTEILDEAINQAESLIFDVAEEQVQSDFVSVGDEIIRVIKNVVQRAKSKESIVGVPTGWAKFDEITSGFQPGQLVVLASRPSMGKSSMALNIARHCAMDKEMVIAYFSLEMTVDELIQRLLSSDSYVPMEMFKKGQWRSDWKDRILNSSARLETAPIWIDDSGDLTFINIAAKCRRLKSKLGRLDMIIVDHIQLMRGTSGRQFDNRVSEMSAITRGLKIIAKDLKCPILALSQLSREVEKRPGSNRPQLSDLRESGTIEQDADIVFFIYRPAVYEIQKVAEKELRASGMRTPEEYIREKHKNDPEFIKRSEIIIAKNRNGPLGTVFLSFDGPTTRFDEVDYTHVSAESSDAEAGYVEDYDQI